MAAGDWSEAFPGELGARPPLRLPDAKTPHPPAHAGCVVWEVPIRVGGLSPGWASVQPLQEHGTAASDLSPEDRRWLTLISL